uniref:Iron-sulfur cluster-binding domain-containing protein n=1 Tax=Candidatus Kentrum sp. MB TaxID=2138164 RepID=A0A451BA62_9GAMM|nr:MAG: Iron-sulfur cluster-binding domain-containing protein [Candidatus Kentron sp. MB]VFK32095.1 MAG: Iron-sulfur cluster-binding domain-containing protein [Candidatus Kentron sp. MB]VFK75164.1 MAG: Iron-sulfur cluster-binding domain-containing protein [Candidatus Kentron sp. MB]
MPDAQLLFEKSEWQTFPVCTQVTLNHGICDSYCISCPVGRLRFGDASPAIKEELSTGRKISMDFDIFSKVADEVAKYPHAWLRLHARGEPLLHPRFVDMVRYAKARGVHLVQAFTDAISLNDAKAHGILDAGLDVLECSVHGHTETYERLMRNGSYRQVVRNIIHFRQLRDDMNKPTRLVVSAVDQPEFQSEKEAHYAFWNQYADEVIYRPYHSWGSRIDNACGAVPETRRPCAQLWTRCTIGPTGKILACFNSWSEQEEEVLGDLCDPDTSITGIWQSARTKRLRQDHMDGNYSLPCCRTCTDWPGSAWGENSYEQLLRNRLNLKGQ